jgi:hypothetical protein
MSKKKRNIFILGRSSDFIDQLTTSFIDRAKGLYSYTFTFGEWNEFLTDADTINFEMLIVDFSSLNDTALFEQYSAHIVRLKKSTKYSRLPIIGLFENKGQIISHSFIIGSGVNYFHMKGDDFSVFFGNIYYIAFEDESHFLKLARALKLQIDVKLKHSCTIQEVNDFQAVVNSDLIIPSESSAEIQDSFEGALVDFEVSDVKSKSGVSSHENSYEIDFMFEGGDWESDRGANIILPQDFESWVVNLDQDKFYIKKKKVILLSFSKKPSWLFKLVSDVSIYDLQLFHSERFNKDVIAQYDTPSFIIQDCVDDEDLDYVDELLNYYSNFEFQPIIILLNHPSRAEALRKMYEFETILVYSHHIDLYTFQPMLDMIKGNMVEQDNYFCLNNISHTQVLDFPVSGRVTSLTENEITFTTSGDEEIPFFTHLNIEEEDFSIGIVVVPSYIGLSPRVNGHHYMGIINRCSEADRQVLRGIVKSFVDDHPTEWGHITLLSGNIEKPSGAIESRSEVEDLVTEEIIEVSVEDKASSDSVGFQRKRIGNSKSKL